MFKYSFLFVVSERRNFGISCKKNMSTKKESRLRKYMKVPIKMVVKARDLYIQSMNQLSSHDLGGAMSLGIPVCSVSSLSRSLSASHSQNSARSIEDRVAELVDPHQLGVRPLIRAMDRPRN